jgi:replicative DNA helicase
MVFSLEMDVQGLTNRLILSEQDIDQHRFSTGRLFDDEEMKLCNAANSLYGLPLTIDDTSGLSVQQIKSRARSQQIKGKCGLVLIDYLQLADMRTQNKTYNREQEVSQASRAAKIMAKELGVPVILLSQLSRQLESRVVKIPLLSDLRESGAIEQDADVVLFIHRPEYYDEKEAVKGEGILRIAKQRDGAIGDIGFKYNHNLTRIVGKNEQLPF